MNSVYFRLENAYKFVKAAGIDAEVLSSHLSLDKRIGVVKRLRSNTVSAVLSTDLVSGFLTKS